jgi:hypothetical protein
MEIKNIVFLFVLAAALGLFGYTARKVFGYLRLGKPDNRFDHFDKRIGNVLAIAFGQTKILRDPVQGPIHAGIFWGFVVLLTAVLESIGEGLIPGFSLRFLGPVYNVIAFGSDIMAAVVLLMVLVALFRRYVSGPKRLRELDRPSQMDATFILLTIAVIMISMLLQHASHIALEGGSFATSWRPVSAALSGMFTVSSRGRRCSQAARSGG